MKILILCLVMMMSQALIFAGDHTKKVDVSKDEKKVEVIETKSMSKAEAQKQLDRYIKYKNEFDVEYIKESARLHKLIDDFTAAIAKLK